jgi:hypothetical protein
MAIAVAVTTNRGAGKDDWVPWQLPEAFRGRNVLALQPLISDLFTSKANISPTARASNLTKIVNVDGTKPFERGAKNAGIHLYEYSEKGEDKGVDGIMYARIAPASTNLEEKAPARDGRAAVCVALLLPLRVPVLRVMVVLLLAWHCSAPCACGPSLAPFTPVLASLSLLAPPFALPFFLTRPWGLAGCRRGGCSCCLRGRIIILLIARFLVCF